VTVRAAIWGLGAMGVGIARTLLDRADIELVAAISRHQAGRDLGEVLGLGRRLGVDIWPDGERLPDLEVDVALITTASLAVEVFPQIKTAIEAGCNVITIAEEMADPRVSSPSLAEEINSLAREGGVTVLGTGINPGFVLDTLIVALTGACLEVRKIKASRVNDLSPFGPTVMRTQGVGTTPEEFAAGLEAGTIVGHIGFPQSIGMIARALGWKLDEIKEEREPIISATYRKTPHVRVTPGRVAGCRHVAYGIKNGEAVIILEHPQQVHPGAEGIETGDYITIEGEPRINLTIKPEIPGGVGTIALAVNMIPAIVKAEPGLVTMDELPVPRLLPADIGKLLGGGDLS